MHPVHPAGAYWPNPDSICVEHEQGDILNLVWPRLPCASPAKRAQEPAPPFAAAKPPCKREALKQEFPGVFQHNPMFSSIQCE